MLEQVATRILEANAKRIADTLIINILTKQFEDVQKSIDNILKAMEQGIVTSSTKEMLEMLEEQKSAVEIKITAEKARGQMQIQKSDILRYIKACIKKDPLPMVTLLIKKVILFKDRIGIYYNYSDTKRPDDDHQAFSFYTTIKEVSKGVMDNETVTYTIELFI